MYTDRKRVSLVNVTASTSVTSGAESTENLHPQQNLNCEVVWPQMLVSLLMFNRENSGFDRWYADLVWHQFGTWDLLNIGIPLPAFRQSIPDFVDILLSDVDANNELTMYQMLSSQNCLDADNEFTGLKRNAFGMFLFLFYQIINYEFS